MKRDSFNVLFFIKKAKLLKNGEASVCMRITVNGARVENNIRKSIEPALWNQAKECAKGKNRKSCDLNAYIEEARIKSKNKATDVAYYYFGWRKYGVWYLDIDKINEGHSFIESPKLFIPCAWGNGRIGEDRLKPLIPEHRSVCFETYLMVGPFETWNEVENAEKYINTKFFHLLVAPLKISQHATQSVYRLVPPTRFHIQERH